MSQIKPARGGQLHRRLHLADYKQSLVHIHTVITSQSTAILNNRLSDVNNSANALKIFYRNYMKSQRTKLEHHHKLIGLLSPANVLKKGFAIIKQRGTIVNNAGSIEKGSDIEILLSDAQLNATVTRKINYDGKEPNI